MPSSHIHSGRSGGSYGVGTGFDADDAGEENEEEELYEDVLDPLDEDSAASDEETDSKSDRIVENEGQPSAIFTKESIDWRVDTLLRKLLLSADFWIEVRGLRSGKARDCHGEVRRV